MRKEELTLNIYRINDRRGCLVVIVKGKQPLKILNVLEPLHFVGWIKQLSMAIGTGAKQDCKYDLKVAGGRDYELKCRFSDEVVWLELCFKHLLRLQWKGSAHQFAAAVDWMIAKLPRFF
ncbi:hypothetical protein ABIE26_000849 [Pedobacter africanus]|uniref:Uncharacterized protein n=1 Tax=Pedobacter africanus TaxID=151894 RepID=A0ACC6KU57_9SPHI|nr:hypothetical protein [Pedobacter africanus]MDR6782663.1 hypothetical protein [Pedobacter africanus]